MDPRVVDHRESTGPFGVQRRDGREEQLAQCRGFRCSNQLGWSGSRRAPLGTYALTPRRDARLTWGLVSTRRQSRSGPRFPLPIHHRLCPLSRKSQFRGKWVDGPGAALGDGRARTGRVHRWQDRIAKWSIRIQADHRRESSRYASDGHTERQQLMYITSVSGVNSFSISYSAVSSRLTKWIWSLEPTWTTLTI